MVRTQRSLSIHWIASRKSCRQHWIWQISAWHKNGRRVLLCFIPVGTFLFDLCFKWCQVPAAIEWDAQSELDRVPANDKWPLWPGTLECWGKLGAWTGQNQMGKNFLRLIQYLRSMEGRVWWRLRGLNRQKPSKIKCHQCSTITKQVTLIAKFEWKAKVNAGQNTEVYNENSAYHDDQDSFEECFDDVYLYLTMRIPHWREMQGTLGAARWWWRRRQLQTACPSSIQSWIQQVRGSATKIQPSNCQS